LDDANPSLVTLWIVIMSQHDVQSSHFEIFKVVDLKTACQVILISSFRGLVCHEGFGNRIWDGWPFNCGTTNLSRRESIPASPKEELVCELPGYDKVMHPEIAQRLEYLEMRKAALIERVRALPPDKQNAKPDAKSFSPVEVIAHIALSEQVTADRMKKVGPKDLIGKTTRTTFIYKRTVDGMNKAKKMNSPAMMIPPERPRLEHAEQSWERARKELLVFFNEVKRPDDPMQQFFIFGTLSAYDVLALLEAHMHYHEVLFPHGS